MVTLAPPDADRANEMVDAVSESLPELSTWLPWATPSYSRDTAEYWVNKIAPRGHEFFIIGSHGEYLGNVGINVINTTNQSANLGYWVRSSAAGQGIATQAVLAFVAWARLNTDINRMEIVAAVGNTRSRRVAEKSGATYEGTAKAKFLLHGAFHDAAVYAFTRS